MREICLARSARRWDVAEMQRESLEDFDVRARSGHVAASTMSGRICPDVTRAPAFAAAFAGGIAGGIGQGNRGQI